MNHAGIADPGAVPPDAAVPRKPSVALALGAGGAKGLAHIGVIEEIEAQGFRITAIAGTSMGALIGGVYAMGKLDVYRDWVTTLDRLDVFKLLDWTFSGGGLIKGERILGTLRVSSADSVRSFSSSIARRSPKRENCDTTISPAICRTPSSPSSARPVSWCTASRSSPASRCVSP